MRLRGKLIRACGHEYIAAVVGCRFPTRNTPRDTRTRGNWWQKHRPSHDKATRWETDIFCSAAPQEATSKKRKKGRVCYNAPPPPCNVLCCTLEFIVCPAWGAHFIAARWLQMLQPWWRETGCEKAVCLVRIGQPEPKKRG